MVSQHIFIFCCLIFLIFSIIAIWRSIVIFFLLWLKGSQRWYSGWSDHGFKSGLPLFKPPVGRVEFSVASSPERHAGLASIYWCFCCFFSSAEFGSVSGRFGTGGLLGVFFFPPQLSCEASGRQVMRREGCSAFAQLFWREMFQSDFAWLFFYFLFPSCVRNLGSRQAGMQAERRGSVAGTSAHALPWIGVQSALLFFFFFVF